MELATRPLGLHVLLPSGATTFIQAAADATAGELLELLVPGARTQLALRRGGRTLAADEPLAPAGPHESLQLLVRLAGGGGDGGATGAESRSSYLEMYKEVGSGKLDAREEQLAAWTCCRLTRSPLGGEDGSRPVVLCQLGYLYDREAVLNALKEKAVDGIPLPPLMAHVRSLKSLTTLKLHRCGEQQEAATAAAASDFREAQHVRFCCPLTGLQLSGRYRFLALVPSGVVVSERALKSAPAAVEELLDGAALASQARVPINGTQEEVEGLRAAAAAAAPPKRKAEKISEPPPAKRKAQSETEEAVRKRSAAPAPSGATKEIWSSIFTSSHAPTVETFAARNLTIRR